MVDVYALRHQVCDKRDVPFLADDAASERRHPLHAQDDMTDRPNIEILICTIDGGIENVPKVLLPSRPDVGYLVSWQHDTEGHYDLPESLSGRKDVRITHLPGRGLSANRNHALSQACGKILLIADDDVRYGPDSFDNILRTFGKYPDASLICFQALDEQGEPMRAYPGFPHKYEERPYGSFVCSWEIALRNSDGHPGNYPIQYNRAAYQPLLHKEAILSCLFICGKIMQ